MRSTLTALALLLTASVPAFSHGSFWKPPDPPPPASTPPNDGPGQGGKSGSGGGVIPGPSTPGAGSPSAGLGASSSQPTTPGTINKDQLTNWSYWWYFNREPLLDLRRRFREQAKLSGANASVEEVTRPSDLTLKNTVLPALYLLAGPKNQDNVRLTAGIAMARIGSPDTAGILANLRALAQSKDPKVQEATMLSLGMLGEFWALEALSAALNEDRSARDTFGRNLGVRERSFAAYGLGVMAAEAPHDAKRQMILEPLWTVLTDPRDNREVRVAAANAVGFVHLGWEPGPTTPEEAVSVPTNRTDLVAALWSLYAGEDDVFVRAHLTVAIARLLADGPEDQRDLYIAHMLKALEARKEPRNQDLQGLIISLGIVGTAWGRESDIQVRTALYAQAREQNDSHARHMAIMSLANIVANSGPSLPPAPVQAEFEAFLVEELSEAREMDKPWYALAAGTLGARLRKPMPGRSIGALGPKLIATLRAIVDEAGSPDTLSATVLALGLAEDLDSGDTVERLFDKTRSKDVRGYAALSLGLLRQSGAMSKLEIYLEDVRYEPVALEHTAIGLALLSRPLAMETLRLRLANAKSGITAAPLALVLGRISDGSSVLPLAQLTADKGQTLAVRENLALALGLIGDPRDLSWRANLATNVNYAAWTPTLFDQAGFGVLNIN